MKDKIILIFKTTKSDLTSRKTAQEPFLGHGCIKDIAHCKTELCILIWCEKELRLLDIIRQLRNWEEGSNRVLLTGVRFAGVTFWHAVDGEKWCLSLQGVPNNASCNYKWFPNFEFSTLVSVTIRLCTFYMFCNHVFNIYCNPISGNRPPLLSYSV